jgi:VWFA-related protein
MLSCGLLLPFVLAQAGSAPAEPRTLSVSVTQSEGEPVTGLAIEEVAVVENGVTREIVRIERDTRPLDLFVLVDTSAAVQTAYRLHIVDAVLALLGRLPAGSRYELWTTGDRPTRLVDLTPDVQEAARALKRVAPQGGSTLLDALIEIGGRVTRSEGGRRAMLVVSAVGTEFSSNDRQRVAERALDYTLDPFSAVLLEEAESPATDEMRLDYDFVLGELSSKTGGLLERPLSSLGVATALRKIAQDLQSRLRIRYATLPELKQRKIEVQVARPGVKVRVGPSAPSS